MLIFLLFGMVNVAYAMCASCTNNRHSECTAQKWVYADASKDHLVCCDGASGFYYFCG